MDKGTLFYSKKWNVSQETIRRWCREGKIPGATKDAKYSPWHIPANAKDPRKEQFKRKK